MLHNYLYNKLIQYKARVTRPRLVRTSNWKDMVVLRVGGKTPLDDKIAQAKRVLDVNISTVYSNNVNVVDIVADAHALPMLEDESVDFVASSHTVEHLTNPIKALLEWKRILAKNGVLYAAIPNYKKTFDHRRQLTPLQHLIDDFDNNTGLDDMSHTEEFLAKYDITKDVVYRDFDSWYANYQTNPGIYTHYHVFDKELVQKMMQYVGFKTIALFHNGVNIEYYGRKQ